MIRYSVLSIACRPARAFVRSIARQCRNLALIGCLLPLSASVTPAVAQDPAEVNDLPGFGIWGPAYRLRNVPDGMRLVVRSGPDRTSGTVGSLPRSAIEILVLNCAPEIAPLVFEDASPADKRALLETAWCEIDHYGMTGHVPGIYLDPILNR